MRFYNKPRIPSSIGNFPSHNFTGDNKTESLTIKEIHALDNEFLSSGIRKTIKGVNVKN